MTSESDKNRKAEEYALRYHYLMAPTTDSVRNAYVAGFEAGQKDLLEVTKDIQGRLELALVHAEPLNTEGDFGVTFTNHAIESMIQELQSIQPPKEVKE